MKSAYEDIIHMPHPTSAKHLRMPMSNRAAQFSPFAALTGYEDAIEETARITDKRIQLDEVAQEELDYKMAEVLQRIQEQPKVKITYFEPDSLKDGGTYLTVSGVIKKVDEYRRDIWLVEGDVIPMKEIVNLEEEYVEEEE